MSEIVNKIYIGRNGIGKTKKLEEYVGSNTKAQNYIYIPCEQVYKDEVQKEKSSAGGNYIYKIKQLIQKIFGDIQNFEYKIDDDILDGIDGRSEFKGKITNFFSSLEEEDFILKSQNILEDVKTIKTLKMNIDGHDTPSGKNNYSLIKILANLLVYANDNNIKIEDSEEYHLIIDEPEKFCHPLLIKKIAEYLKIVATKINVIVATHSPLFLTHFIDNSTTKIVNLREENGDIIEKDVTLNEISNKLKSAGIQQTEAIQKILLHNKIIRKDIFNGLFAEKIILTEDVSTKVLIELILNENNKFNQEVLICHGVTELWKYQCLFEAFGFSKDNIKYVVDLDGKPGGKAEAKLRKNFSSEQAIYEFPNNLEIDLEINGTKKNALNVIDSFEKIKTKTKQIYSDICTKLLND